MRREIKLPISSSLEEAVNALLDAKARGESVYCKFNGHKLYSDTVTMDSAYLEITGQTKADFDRDREETHRRFVEERKLAEQRAQVNIPNWIQEGQSLIFPERHEAWEKTVVASANALYHGADLDSSLEIMHALENGATMEEATKIFDGQGHSGMSASIVRGIIFEFSSKGPEFWEATARGKISPQNKRVIEAKKQENIKLVQANELKSSGPKL